MKKINSFLITITICFSLVYLLFNFNISKLILILIIIFLLFLPKIIKNKFKVNDKLELFYTIFIILTLLIGFVFKVYDILKYYDRFVHFLSGILNSALAISILNNTKLKNRTIIFDILFIIVFSISISSLWEILEYISDLIFNCNFQDIETGVNDTMLDMILSLTSTIIFSIVYYFKTNKLVNN